MQKKELKAVYHTLGCKLNFAETSSLGKFFAEQGIEKAQTGEPADICVINTCSVTESADKKCRQAIRHLKKQHPNAFMVVTGCYAQLKPEEVKNIEGVDWVMGKDLKTFVPSCSKDDRTRHFLKVQDGCDYFCTYCTIPLARGRSRNGKISDLVAQAEQVAQEGGKEIVLTGINIGDFGKSTGETFFELIQALDKIKGIERFRISSIEPNLLTEEILSFIAQSQRFMPHFHLPLQAGSDAVLKLMHRRYDTAFFKAKIAKVKEILPNAFIGVDVIVGTRGETQEYFEETLHFLEDLPFSQLHVFPYSERPGTMALKIQPVVTPLEKQERSRILQALSDQKLADFYRSQISTTHPVLFEHTQKNNKMFGFTDNYVKVETEYNMDWVNQIKGVTLTHKNTVMADLIRYPVQLSGDGGSLPAMTVKEAQ